MLAVVSIAAPAWASETPEDLVPSLAPLSPQAAADMAIMEEAHGLYDAKDYAGSARALERFMATPTYQQLPAGPRATYRTVYLETLIRSDRSKDAFPELKALTETDTTGGMWTLRLEAAVKLGDYGDALKTLTVLSERWPATVPRLTDAYVLYILSKSRTIPALRDRRTDALLALYESKWTLQDSFAAADELRLDLVRGLLDEGKVAKAREVAATITLPSAIVAMRSLRRFDAVISPGQSDGDLAQIADRHVLSLRSKISAAPDKLKGPVTLAGSLYSSVKLTDALAVVDDAIARAVPSAGGAPPFTDMDQLIWAYDRKARILLMLGRGDEAVAAMQAGAALQEHGNDNVSQQLNLAEFYATLGRPKDALAAAGRVGDDHVSGYGRMDREGVRVEALVQLHDQAGLKMSLDYMHAHEADAPMWLFEALLVSGDEEGAARDLIKLLKDPVRQAGALGELLDRATPDTAPDWVKMRQGLIRALRQRPDVKAAVAAAGGRLLSLPFLDEEQ